MTEIKRRIKTDNSNKIGIRFDKRTLEKVKKLAEKRGLKPAALCRNIIKDFFVQDKIQTIEKLKESLEEVVPDLREHTKEYGAMKDALKQTINATFEMLDEIREMKRGDYLTYKTLKIQTESVESLLSELKS